MSHMTPRTASIGIASLVALMLGDALVLLALRNTDFPDALFRGSAVFLVVAAVAVFALARRLRLKAPWITALSVAVLLAFSGWLVTGFTTQPYKGGFRCSAETMEWNRTYGPGSGPC